MSALDLDAISREWLNQCGPHDFGVTTAGCACPDGDPRPVISRLVTEVERLTAENANLREQLDRVNAGRQQLAEELADPAFCRRCGHACAHNPPHRLVDTTDGPVCEDVEWCMQLRHADEAFRMGIGAERLEGAQ